MTPQDFIAALTPAAQQSMSTSKIPASFVIAEGALESGWGSSMLAQQAMNLFGVKADSSWTGDTYSLNTREFLDGSWVMVPALWRKYNNWLDCINDHAAFLLNNPRYSAAFKIGGDVIAFTNAIAAAGYATDPDYANKIISIIQGHSLQALDVVA